MNLKDYVRLQSKERNQPLSLPVIKNITKQIIVALMFCHSKGLMHRNLKPDNILVSDSGQVKICDFTLSRIGVQKDVAYTPEDPKERERSGREA